jgi:hypothetical protein
LSSAPLPAPPASSSSSSSSLPGAPASAATPVSAAEGGGAGAGAAAGVGLEVPVDDEGSWSFTVEGAGESTEGWEISMEGEGAGPSDSLGAAGDLPPCAPPPPRCCGVPRQGDGCGCREQGGVHPVTRRVSSPSCHCVSMHSPSLVGAPTSAVDAAVASLPLTALLDDLTQLRAFLIQVRVLSVGSHCMPSTTPHHRLVVRTLASFEHLLYPW